MPSWYRSKVSKISKVRKERAWEFEAGSMVNYSHRLHRAKILTTKPQWRAQLDLGQTGQISNHNDGRPLISHGIMKAGRLLCSGHVSAVAARLLLSTLYHDASSFSFPPCGKNVGRTLFWTSLSEINEATSASHALQSSSETSTLANTDTKLQRLIGLEDHRRRGTDNTVQWALSLFNLDPSLWGVNVRPFSGYLPCQLCSLHGLTPTTRSYYVTYLWVIIWHMGFKHPRGKLALPLSTLNPCHMLSTLWLAWCTMMI